MTQNAAPRVFISHSSKDKPAVIALAEALRARGIDAWLDQWEIAPGDSIVGKINEGLDQAEAGIVVFSKHTMASAWVEAELHYLIYARVQEGKLLVPVVVGDEVNIPPLIRPLARRGIEELDAITAALLGRHTGPPPIHRPERGKTHRVLISLKRSDEDGIRTTVIFGDKEYAASTHSRLPRPLITARDAFLKGFRAGIRRDRDAAQRTALESTVADLGRLLGGLCLPGDAGAALAQLADGCPIGTTIEVVVEASDSELLGLPFEAIRLPGDRLLATLPAVVMWRRPIGLAEIEDFEPFAGPLKVLVAVGAPDEGQTASAVLDLERELQNILDAVEPARQHENAEVRILEVGHPEAIAGAFEADAYHILHISCHGGPGVLELENEEGRAVPIKPAKLIEKLKNSGRPLPLVLLSACHGGVQEAKETASFAESLLGAGVAYVLAMQTSVSDYYASELARAFYENLAKSELARPSRALSKARKELEARRLKAVQRGEHLEKTQPEYATAALFVGGEEKPLVDFGLDKIPLSKPPVYQMDGAVPQLRVGDLIGRRKALRETLGAIRSQDHQYVGVVLTGMGGVGKSVLAGRTMQKLREDEWLLVSHAGRFDVGQIAGKIGLALLGAGSKEAAQVFLKPDLDDALRFQLILKMLAETRVVLVLDDFEQNLREGGSGFLDAATRDRLLDLAKNAREGRILITCRYPIPVLASYLRQIAIGPLSPAESRKLLLRLEGLRDLGSKQVAKALAMIGGHPRMLEFLDALMRGGREARLPQVIEKMSEIAEEAGIELDAQAGQMEASLEAALQIGMRDIFLDALLDAAREENLEDILLQTAVSNLPVAPDGIARMLAETPEDPIAAHLLDRALDRLAALSLIYLFPDKAAWVHRWTAEGLARIDAVGYRARCIRAGRYRMWRVQHESRNLEDAVEAMRNFFAGEDYDAAAASGQACIGALGRFNQTIRVAALAAEALETLPEEHDSFAAIADAEARAYLSLGETSRAKARYLILLENHERLAAAEPDRADYQRDLSVSYNKMGDLYAALGQGEQAREAFAKALGIAERLAAAEPDRADYQRDLSVSYERMGDLYAALGQGEQAREAHQQALGIRERLAAAEPDRADYQRDLSFSYNKMGDLYAALGQGEQAREAFAKDLEIAERLAAAEPDRADYQRDLVVSLVKIGGQADTSQAKKSFNRALRILETLKREGRLNPADEGMIPTLKNFIQGIDKPSNETPNTQ